MQLKDLFNQWALFTAGRYRSNQWLLSKWDTLDGLPVSEEKISALFAHIDGALDLKSRRRILDAGCGGGWMAERLGSSDRQCVGVDISFEMLRNSEHKNSKIVCADLCALPFQPEVFDAVLCYFVFINFLNPAEIKRAVDELLRVTEPGGRILIGQLPDKHRSEGYDAAKEEYRRFCNERFPHLRETRDQHPIPIQLYERGFWTSLLDERDCTYSIRDSFNPFFRPGQPSTVDWRFDMVIQKADR